MKKLLIIILTLLLISCEKRCDTCNHEPVIIYKHIQEYNQCICNYDYKGLGKENHYASFTDSCSKYSIGDTIK